MTSTKRKIKKIKKKVRKNAQHIVHKTSKSIHKRKHIVPLTLFIFIIISISIPLLTRTTEDTRAKRLESYMNERNMPVAEHAETFIAVADYYDLDWRLLPALAIRESSGGKRMMNQNPFGWGSAKIPFETIDDAIWEVGRNLSGNNTSTAKWYTTTSTYEKLWWYNGTVVSSYPHEVMWIMEQF